MRENSTRGFAPWTHCVARLAQPYRLPPTVQYPAGRPKGSPHKRQVQVDETTFSRRGEGEFTRVGIWRRCLGSDFVPVGAGVADVVGGDALCCASPSFPAPRPYGFDDAFPFCL